MKISSFASTTAIATAVTGALALGVNSAYGADVDLYGKIDMGLQYQNVQNSDGTSEDTWGMESGQNAGSRIGLKGTEQLSDNVTVGFQLEQGFNVDSGEDSDSDRAFSRESRVFVTMPYGEVSFGRMGAIDSGNGTYGLMEKAGVFGTGWSTIGSAETVLYGMSTGRMDNTITYVTPDLGGAKFYGQVSLNVDSTVEGTESSSKVDRYYAIGAVTNYEAFEWGITFSVTDYANTEYLHGVSDPDNGVASTTYASYDFGFVKPVVAFQWFSDARQSRYDDEGFYKPLAEGDLGLDGIGVMIGATAPVYGGTAYASLGYRNAEYSDWLGEGKVDDWDLYQVGVGYKYPLSKRTYAYGALGYTTEDKHGTWTDDKDVFETAIGLVHNF